MGTCHDLSLLRRNAAGVREAHENSVHGGIECDRLIAGDEDAKRWRLATIDLSGDAALPINRCGEASWVAFADRLAYKVRVCQRRNPNAAPGGMPTAGALGA